MWLPVTSMRRRGFSGNFRTVLSAAGQAAMLQYSQADLGLTLGGTPRAAGTAPTVLTISGSSPVALGFIVDMPLGGARGTSTYRVSVDNGATWTAPVVTSADEAPAVLQGIHLLWPVGVSTSDNTYRSTSAANADQSGNGKHFTQAVAANQFNVIGAGLNGRVSLQALISTFMDAALTLSAPSVGAPIRFIYVFSTDTWQAVGANDVLLCNSAGTSMFFITGAGTPVLRAHNATSGGDNTGAAVGSWVRARLLFNNATTNYLRNGSTNTTGTNMGGNSGGTRQLGYSAAGRTLRHSLVQHAVFSEELSGADDAAWDAAITSYYGAGVAVG